MGERMTPADFTSMLDEELSGLLEWLNSCATANPHELNVVFNKFEMIELVRGIKEQVAEARALLGGECD